MCIDGLLPRPDAVDPAGGLTVLRLSADDTAIRRWAAPIAAATRRAYADSDPVPGLPLPDGARSSTAEVAAELRNGVTAWVAFELDGTPAGIARVRDHGAGGWEVRRLATVPSSKRHGVGQRIMREVERAAVDARIPRVWLNAVVERCLPPFYARLGYHVIEHWPSPDKMLSEVTMQRAPDARPHPAAFPWSAVAPPTGTVVCWFTVGTALLLAIIDGADSVIAAVRVAANRMALAGVRSPRLAGVDLPTGDMPHPRRLLAGLGDGTADVRRIADDRLSVRCHLTPRTVHTGLLAFWRLSPGHEAAAPSWR